jgi:hypothetical protein
MINQEDLDQRRMTVTYTIENIINGLKYIDNEIDVNTPIWNTFRLRMEAVDSNVEKIIDLIEIRKNKEQNK